MHVVVNTSPVYKKYRIASLLCIFEASVALFSEQYTKGVLKRYVVSTFCTVDRVDLVCGTCKADSLKHLQGKNDEKTSTGGLVHQITVEKEAIFLVRR